MPKATHAGASYYGYEGHVVDARDRVSELDPSRNVDGSIVDGFESEEREIEDRGPENKQDVVVPADLDTRRGEATPIEPPSPQADPADDEDEEPEAADEEPEAAKRPAPAKRASSLPRARGGARK